MIRPRAGRTSLRRGRRRLAAFAWVAFVAGLLLGLAGVAGAAGPPYPDPVTGQRVYDTAGVLSPATLAETQRISDAIEARTGAQVVVYTQLKPDSDTTELARADALALMNQWGIGRKGFDDGLVILFDLDESLRHGQVQLFAGPGFQTTFLSNGERQAIYENDMLPLLRNGDLDGAVLAALAKVDAAATVDHAQSLDRGRIVNAIIGLLVGPGLFFLLVGWAIFHWLRFGRDPVFVDDPSVLMPAPPADLTAASGALVYDGQSSRRTLTTALLDLASRGELAFEQKDSLLSHKVSLRPHGTEPATDQQAARRRLNARRPLSDAETYALGELRHLGPGDVLEDEDLLKFGKSVPTFDKKLEAYAVDHAWFAEAPGKVSTRWAGRGVLEIIAGSIALFVGFTVPFSGLVVLAVGLIAAGGVTVILARAMPARTMAGATIRAMLAAYRRTLQKTMDQARSMDQVVNEARLDWIETPDQAMVWAVALGLQNDAEQVLQRSAEDVKAGRSGMTAPWFPVWYGTSQSFAGGAGIGGGGSVFSASAVPDFGGMFGALGAVGNSPSSSGGGGGFGGGGGGGGGGGAGGGF